MKVMEVQLNLLTVLMYMVIFSFTAIPQATIVFSEGMSDTDFLEFLKKKGVQDGDCAIIQSESYV